MAHATPSEAATLRAGWLALARAHPWAAAGMMLSVVVMAGLLLASGARVASGEIGPGVRLGFLGGLAAFGATAVGALPAAFVRGLSQRMEDSMLGLAAGMMLAASAFSLVLPGLEAGTTLTGNAFLGAIVVTAGLGLGTLFMLGLEAVTPHTHPHAGTWGPPDPRLGRVWLFVLAITLHNLPEGMAIGVGFSHADLAVGVPLTTAIAIQDIPEGLAVAMALRAVGPSAWSAVLLGAATGLMEPIGALLGVGLSAGLALAYPVGLGLAAGAMLFVVSHEVIPETHRNGHQTPATVGLMAGFALMMVLDTTLG